MIWQLRSSLFNFVCLLNVHPYAESGFELNDRNGSAILREFPFGQVYVIFCPALIQAVFFIIFPGQNLKRNMFQVLFLPSAGNTRFMGLFGRLQTVRISGLQPLDSYPFQVRMPYKIFGKMSENARSGQKTGKNARSDQEFYHCFRGSPSGRIRVFAMVSALSCLDWESKWA